MSEKARESQKEEMRRVYDVLRHLKKKVGTDAFSEEYKVIMSELKESLGIVSKKNKKANGLSTPTGQKEGQAVNIQEPEDDYSDNEVE